METSHSNWIIASDRATSGCNISMYCLRLSLLESGYNISHGSEIYPRERFLEIFRSESEIYYLSTNLNYVLYMWVSTD